MPRPEAGRQRTATSVGNPLHALAIGDIAPLLAVQFLFMTAFYGTYAFFGDHLRGSLDLSAGTAGFVVLCYGVGFGLAAIGDGQVDRMGPARILPPALGLVAFAYATMPVTFLGLSGAFAAAFAWGFANHFVLNVVVLRLSETGGEMLGAVLGLNTAVTYGDALVSPLALSAVYASAGFAWLALGASGCVALAAVVMLATRSKAAA